MIDLNNYDTDGSKVYKWCSMLREYIYIGNALDMNVTEWIEQYELQG